MGGREARRKMRGAAQYALDKNVVRDTDVIFASDREPGIGTDKIEEEDFDRRLRDASSSRKQE